MKLFLQGMRRSGTTIVYDILSQDERLDLYYEPFSAGRQGALGGGSGIQPVDLMEKIRRIRQRFAEVNGLDLSDEDFNHGAPKNPGLELEPELPGFCRDYIRYLCDQSAHTVCKFTRLYSKTPVLAEIEPDSVLAILVRDPKEVVASYLYGRDQHRLENYGTREHFFGRNTEMNAWKCRDFFEGICAQWNRPEWERAPDWIRPLVVWHYTFKRCYEDAQRCYPGRHLVWRYEDLTKDPKASIESIFRLSGLEPSERAMRWAQENVRPSRKECYRDDPRWEEAFDTYGIRESLARAGYQLEEIACA